MRVLAVFAISTSAFLVPALASADPAQPSAPTTSTSLAAPAQTTATAQSTASMQAAPAQQAAATATTASNVNLNEIVCRSEPPPTGSRLGATRECHTVEQWNQREREEQRMLQQQQVINSHLSN
jgi:hypothetical protein